MDIQTCAKLALQVQDACNLTAIVGTFSDVLKTLTDEKRCSNEVKNHVITTLFIDKIVDLSGKVVANNLSTYSDAYHKCQALAEGE